MTRDKDEDDRDAHPHYTLRLSPSEAHGAAAAALALFSDPSLVGELQSLALGLHHGRALLEAS